MEIVLHLGAHRTATTTLQRTLGAGQATLQAAGLRYWGPKRLRAGLFRGLYARTPLPWEADRAIGRVQMRLADVAQSGADGLIVSEENMLGTLRMTLADGLLYPGAGARVARFAAAFAGHDLTLGLAIRRYDLWWASALAFMMPRGGPMPHETVCVRLAAQPRRWRDVILEIAEAVPQARLLVWSFEGTAPWSTEHLSALTGRAIDLDGTDGWHNAQMSPTRLRQIAVEAGADARVIRTEDGRFCPFDADQREVFKAHYDADLEWLAAGADGAADYLATTDAQDVGVTGLGRGSTDERWRRDDGHHRRVARAC